MHGSSMLSTAAVYGKWHVCIGAQRNCCPTLHHPQGAAFLMDWANSALMPGLLNMATVILEFQTLMPKLRWTKAAVVAAPVVKSMGWAGMTPVPQ